jgi:hypothetical protein
MQNDFEYKAGSGVLNDHAKTLLWRFLGILLTAGISALITFFQSLLTDPSLAPLLQANMEESAITGGLLRTAIEVLNRRS